MLLQKVYWHVFMDDGVKTTKACVKPALFRFHEQFRFFCQFQLPVGLKLLLIFERNCNAYR